MTLERRFVLLSALRWLPLGVVVPLLVLVPTARGLDLAAIGLITAAHGIVAVVLEVPSGALADTIGRRRTLLAGALLTAVALAVFAFALATPAFALAEGVLAAGRATISGALEAWFVDALRASRPDAPLERPLARSSAASAAALGIGALLGGLVPLLPLGLAHDGGATLLVYTPAVLAAAGAAVVFAAAVALLVHEPPRAATAGHAAPGFAAAFRRTARTTARELRASRPVRLLLAVSAALGLGLSSIEMLWQPRLTSLLGSAHHGTWLFGVLAAVAMSATATGAVAAPWLTRRLGGARSAYAVTLGLSAVALAALALTAGPTAFALAYVAVYGVTGGYEPLHNALLHDAAPSQVRATLASVDALALQLGVVVSGLTLAPLAERVSVRTAWLAAAAVLLAATALVLRLPRTEPASAPDPQPEPAPPAHARPTPAPTR